MHSTTFESLPCPFVLSKGLLPASASTLCVAAGNRLLMNSLPNSLQDLIYATVCKRPVQDWIKTAGKSGLLAGMISRSSCRVLLVLLLQSHWEERQRQWKPTREDITHNMVSLYLPTSP